MKKASAVAAILITVLLMSCSDDIPSIKTTEAITVLSYDSEDAPPSVRLAVFVEVSSNVRRVDAIHLTPPDAAMDWTAREEVIVASGAEGAMWAGCTTFVMPDGGAFPAGQYIVKYTDALGHEEYATVNVAGSETEESADSKHRMAVYDEGGALLYYGDVNDTWQSIEGAFSERECIVSGGNDSKVIRMMATKYKTQQGEQQTEDGNG